MSSEAYELLAMLMRYIFVVLGAVILLRVIFQLRRDSRAHKKEMKQLPDAGLVGEVVDLDTGKSHPLPREGLMGSGSACDIRLKRRGVRRKHALFSFVDGKGLRIKPHLGSKVEMEGVQLRSSAYALHGTQVTLANAHIRIRLFAGLNVPNPAAFRPDVNRPVFEEEESMDYSAMPPFVQMPMAEEWQEEGYADPWQQPVQPLQQPLPVMPEEGDGEDYVPYQSPVVRHRRSERR